MRIYLDTSVPSTYFDDRTPERQKATQSFWTKASKEKVTLCVSNVVITEIEKTPDIDKRNRMLELIEPLERLVIGPEVSDIAEALVASNLVPKNKIEDAEHLAVAALHHVDVLVSWNFRHMINLKIRQRLPLLLAQNGCFKKYELISPFEYLGE